jgi:glutamine amidotransferase
LGWVDAEVVRLEPGNGLRVPHVGWNAVDFIGGAIMFDNIDMQSPHFYFDHSYHFECDEQYVVAVADYGGPVVSAICKGNVWATQFHPEKSQRNGLKLLRNYVKFVAGGLGGCCSHCGGV